MIQRLDLLNLYSILNRYYSHLEEYSIDYTHNEFIQFHLTVFFFFFPLGSGLTNKKACCHPVSPRLGPTTNIFFSRPKQLQPCNVWIGFSFSHVFSKGRQKNNVTFVRGVHPNLLLRIVFLITYERTKGGMQISLD